VPKVEEIESKDLTRRKILDVARRTFALHGFEGGSVDAIVKASGLSKGALYWHFPGKLELFREIMGEEARLILRHFEIPLEMKGKFDPVEFLIEKGGTLLDEFSNNHERRLLWVDLTVVAQRGDPQSKNLAGEMIDRVLDAVLPELNRTFRGTAPEGVALNPRDRLICLTHAFGGLVMNLGLRLNAEEAKRYWETMVRVLLEEGCRDEKP
jgi:AcrR family transcriptional regulator